MIRKLCLLLWSASTLLAVDPRPYLGEPALSPDAAEIAFISGGDIWTVPARGGEARLLVSHPATESAPHYSPDGKYLAFTSTRTGGGDVYLLTFATGDLKRLTYDDASERVEGWSADSHYIYFSSGARDIGTTDIYRVHREGGTPMQVSADRYTSEYFAAPAPDGQTLAFNARGMAGSQWWRKGHSHLDESEIWLRHEASPATYERVTEGGAKEAWPMWARDGKSIFYMSDRSGAQNIWHRPLKGAAKQITRFTDGRVVWPSISADGRTIVFERDFRVWKLDTESGKAAPVEIARRGSPAGPAVQHLTVNNQFQDLMLSPDGKKVAFVSHGEVFAASAKDGGEAARLTQTPAAESQLAWAPDSRRLVYVSDRNGIPQLYLYDFTAAKESQLTSIGPDAAPRFSPDGKSLAFLRDGKELRILDVAAKQEHPVATGYFDKPPLLFASPYVWSPDSQWLAFFNESGKAFANLYAAPAKGGAAQPLSFLANTSGHGAVWSPDGKYLLFITGQRTEPDQIARIDLILRTPHFREDQFRDLFKEDPVRPAPNTPPVTAPATAPATAATAETKPADAKPADAKPGDPAKAKTPDPVKITFEGIHDRLSLLSTGVDAGSIVISPDGKTAVLTASAAGQQNLYSYPLDELSRDPRVARQLTSTPGGKSSVQFSPDGKEVFYLDRGSIASINLDSRAVKTLSVTAELDVDFSREKMEVFQQAWTAIRDQFFDPKFNGVNWDAVRTEYEPLIAGCTTPDEMRLLLNLMVGELNASHLGAGGGGGNGGPSTGRLGVRFDRAEYETSGRLKVTEVIPLSPAHVSGIKVGDVIESVNGVAVDPHTNLDALLDYKIGKRVVLKVSGKDVPVQPVNLATERELLYREWVEQNRAYVAKISGGKLGYVHMQDMSEQAMNRLHLDLDAENQSRQGVVIDIRNNNGGFVNAYALDVFARRPYLTMTERGKPQAPARAILGQRALESPTVLVVNQHSLSDAEDFTEGYRALKLGKVVGEPTAGWIIFTWGTTLLDGTSFRLPHSRIRGADGSDMELHPRPVDIQVSRPVGESYTGKDSQLDAAVKALLGQL
ncbi:MAG TPA: S41 family peptidase [Candidatus Sulfopaludibacter sp.]|nr:S41 family peptidase [Candidatus Sulfopaludibacter sp.]